MKTMILTGLTAFLLLSCNKTLTEDSGDREIPNVPKRDVGDVSNVVLIKDELEGKKIVVAGNAKDLYIVSFERELDGVLIEFSPSEDPLPAIMEDTEGNTWDIFGFAISGPRKGQRLKAPNSLMGYWFSLATFYPGIEIYSSSDRGEFEGKLIQGTDNWLIPENEVRSGGPGKDGIPAISKPRYDNASDASFLGIDELVVGMSDGSAAKAYPHQILDWHEIVNDSIGDIFYSMIYCPLTGTATAWDRVLDGKVSTFGVSGLLYNTNIVPYDRLTDSNWSQLFNAAVYGKMKGTEPKIYMVLETKWETWKTLFPESKVLNTNTGFSRSYGSYPYGNYRSVESLIFPVKFDDKRLFAKERVHGVIIDGKARVYRFNNFNAR